MSEAESPQRTGQRAQRDRTAGAAENVELRAEDQEWLKAHEEAAHARTELELKRLEAEDELARLARQLEEARIQKEEEMEGIRAREEVLRAREREIAWRARRREDVAYQTEGQGPRRDPEPREVRRSSAVRSRREPAYPGDERTGDVTTNVPTRVVDEAARFWRSLTLAYVHQLRVAADAASAVADSVQQRSAHDDRDDDVSGFRRSSVRPRGRGTDRASSFASDVVTGFWDGVDRALDMPSEGVERFYDAYARRS